MLLSLLFFPDGGDSDKDPLVSVLFQFPGDSASVSFAVADAAQRLGLLSTDNMAMKGKGPMAVGLMWMLTVIVLCFVALRTYTRLVVVKSYGMDDHVYAFAFVGEPTNLHKIMEPCHG